MDPNIWAKLHGASTHFPIALVLAALPLEALALVVKDPPRRRGLRATTRSLLIIGALGSLPAVWTGLVMTKGETFGKGALLWHHLFVWPAFTVLIGLAAWRSLVREDLSPNALRWYLFLLLLNAALIAGAGYWGGEMLINP